MSNRGSVIGSKYNNGKLMGSVATCGQCNTLNAANERQSKCAQCNPQHVAKQLSYRNYMTRATSSVSSIAGYSGKGNGIRARVIDSTGKFAQKAQTWKRPPSFDTSSYIDNKKSTVIQCTQPGATGAAGLPHGCHFQMLLQPQQEIHALLQWVKLVILECMIYLVIQQNTY